VAAGCGGDGLFEGSGGATTTNTTSTGGQTTTTTTSQGGGTGGSGASGGAGGAGPIEPECNLREDCQLVNDCCDCMGIPADVVPPSCPQQCLQPSCSAVGLNLVKSECEVGRCVLSASCNPSTVTCEVVQPSCPPGQAAAVVGTCWGGCIPTTECSEVADCSACNGPTDTCVAEETQTGRIYHCVEAPSTCTDCACLGPSVCLEPFDTCTDIEPGIIACSCPTCDF
jgi:hypothetical protein